MTEGAAGRIDTRTVLFTDLVASTELRVRLGEEAAEIVRRVHDSLVGDAITTSGGVVVKGLGDGVMATFAAAADAVTAAVAVQQAAEANARRDPAQAFAVRIGISVGDVTVEADDVFGIPVVEASRLCGAAGTGEILAADLVRVLSRGRGGTVFEPMGELELKGLPEAVLAARVVWEPVDAQATTPFPSALDAGASTGYVGRVALLDALAAQWQRAVDGAAGAALLAGEPGVGKTRTAAEAARAAHRAGALVLYGRCDEDLGVPYQPFVEALDWYAGAVPDPTLGRLPGELARLLPDLGLRVAGLPPAVTSDPRSEEHRLFEAVASWLVEASRDGGLVLVLDDLHWAAKPTLLLLLHVLRAAADPTTEARLLVVGTYRDTDIDRAHPLSGVLADLRRVPGVERVAVSGLTPDEVLALLETAAGHPLGDDVAPLALAIHDETEGNPFFVGEVVRHLVEEGVMRREDGRWVAGDLSRLAVPEGVRDVVGRRLSRLSAAANDVLAAAAVVGREMDLDVLATLLDQDEDRVLDALDEALRARLVDEVGPDRFRFAHALVRSTLYDEQSATRRRRAHRQVADVLERLHPDDVVSLAFHCVEAGSDDDRALRYTLSAARQAQDARALAEAEQRYRQALELSEESTDAPARAAALIGIGECQRDQGDADFRDTLLEAAAAALATDDTSALVRAVVGNSRGFTSVIGAVDEERVEVLRMALERVGPEPSADRALVLAQLASELAFVGDGGQLAVADEAEAIARDVGDRALLAWILVRIAFATFLDDRWEQLIVRNAEAVRLSDETGDPSLRVLSRNWLSSSLLAGGRFADAEATIEEAHAIATSDGAPSDRWSSTAMRTKFLQARGRYEEAAANNDAALAMAQATGEPDGSMWWLASMATALWVLGYPDQLAAGAGDFAEQYPGIPTWRGAQLVGLFEAGQFDEARRVWEQTGLTPERMAVVPFPFSGMTQLSFIAYHLGDQELARACVDHLAPFRTCWSHHILGTFGPVAWQLALAHAALGELDEAIALTDESLAMVGVDGLVGLSVPPRRSLIELLRRRGGPGDDERAEAEAATLAEEKARIGAV